MVYISKKRAKVIFYNQVRKFVVLAILPFVTFFVLSVLLLNISFFKFDNYIVDAEYDDVTKDQVKKTIGTQLSEKYFYLYSKNNFLFYPKKDIAKHILNKNYEIDFVDIFLSNKMNTLNIAITKRTPLFIYCAISDNTCLYVDKKGVAFKNIIDISDKNKTKFLVFRTKDIALGEKVFTTNVFNSLIDFVAIVEKSGVKVLSIEESDTDFIYIVTLEGDTKIIVSRNQDLLLAGENFLHILKDKHFKINNTKQRFVDNMHYINLAHEKFVFFCINNQECKDNY